MTFKTNKNFSFFDYVSKGLTRLSLINICKVKPLLPFIASGSIFFLIYFSPEVCFFWLLIPSFYFFYNKKFGDIYTIWAVPFLVWYIIFSYAFSDFGPVIAIGGNETAYLQYYLITNDTNMWFSGNLCHNTVFLLGNLTKKFGFLIYIPTPFYFLF